MSAPPVVTLLSDFGYRDPFVGLMKAAVVQRCPTARLLDLTHDIEPQSVAQGAWWLKLSESWLPEGSIVLAVVDPGVGGARRAVVVQSGGRLYVAPDNGLVEWAARVPGSKAFSIEPSRVNLTVPSHTFHGRDLFAPVAGLLAAGSVSPKDVGPLVEDDLVPAPFAEPVVSREGITGQVVLIDRFGNLITNVTGAMMRDQQATAVQIRGVTLRLARTYADVALGEMVALENAFGLVEIACRDGDARQRTGLGIGESVWVHPGASV